MQTPKNTSLQPAEDAEAPKEKNTSESSGQMAKGDTEKTADDSAPGNKPITLKLSKRMEDVNGDTDTDTDKAASPDLVLTWEEFFMGLAELQRVFCNVHDSNANAKVWTYQ